MLWLCSFPAGLNVCVSAFAVICATYLGDVPDGVHVRHGRGLVGGHDHLSGFFVDLDTDLLQMKGPGFGCSAYSQKTENRSSDLWDDSFLEV